VLLRVVAAVPSLSSRTMLPGVELSAPFNLSVSILLFVSVMIALLAVKVPAVWSNISAKTLPPITRLAVPDPMNNLSGPVPLVPNAYASSPAARLEPGTSPPVERFI